MNTMIASPKRHYYSGDRNAETILDEKRRNYDKLN